MRAARVALVVALAACQGKSAPSRSKAEPASAGAATATGRDAGAPGLPPPARVPEVKPPLPVAAPPADAETLTGIEDAPAAVVHIKRLTAGSGAAPGRNDTVTVNYTGWRPGGQTFVSTLARKRPVQQSLAMLAPGFAAAVATMKPGERAMIWVPPELGYLGVPTGTPEATVYEVELVAFEPAPPTPPDVAAAPASARRTKSGAAYVSLRAGTGKVKPRAFDFVKLDYSVWTATGRLVDSTAVTRRPKSGFLFREPPGLDEVLRTMVVGERVRVWLPADQVEPPPGVTPGPVCYEVELLDVRAMQPPPPVPTDVAAPPPAAARTAGGVFYRVLRPGTGTEHPRPTDKVKVHYTGWTTDGRLFDSTIVKQEPAVFVVNRVFPGWGQGLATMVPGQETRFWIPAELAFKDQPGAPHGMLVMDTTLLEILPPSPPPAAAP